jgi:hypothetical protein
MKYCEEHSKFMFHYIFDARNVLDFEFEIRLIGSVACKLLDVDFIGNEDIPYLFFSEIFTYINDNHNFSTSFFSLFYQPSNFILFYAIPKYSLQDPLRLL